MPKNRCKICRGAVCGFPSRNKDFFSPGSSTSGNRALGSPQSQEVDPMFTVSYERQQAQDRETIWSILTGGTPPVSQHQGGSQSRGSAPIGSQASDSTRYGGMALPYAAATDGYPTGPRNSNDPQLVQSLLSSQFRPSVVGDITPWCHRHTSPQGASAGTSGL
ncbi:uncharacterized protein EI90DRAFT_3036172, partial [Cantharellus anzutake]|uniref:uncharacterized protein n=1 Tax=Cantharellus anzutake TaxID=1750568 RepID=UPI001903F8BE